MPRHLPLQRGGNFFIYICLPLPREGGTAKGSDGRVITKIKTYIFNFYAFYYNISRCDTTIHKRINNLIEKALKLLKLRHRQFKKYLKKDPKHLKIYRYTISYFLSLFLCVYSVSSYYRDNGMLSPDIDWNMFFLYLKSSIILSPVAYYIYKQFANLFNANRKKKAWNWIIGLSILFIAISGNTLGKSILKVFGHGVGIQKEFIFEHEQIVGEIINGKKVYYNK